MSEIFYDIKKSTYVYICETGSYFFSSLFYKHKFMDDLKKNREELYYRLSSRYLIDFDANQYFDVILYSNIEKRGFKIITPVGEELKCLKEIVLSGEIKILQRSEG